MILAELGFGQTVIASALNSIFTATFVGIAATIIATWYGNRLESRRQSARLLHEGELQREAIEHESRSALRDTYAQLLVAQRRSRQASVLLAEAGGENANGSLVEPAILAHDQFIDLYHRLSLDASKDMWLEAGGLRRVLDRMLECGRSGNATECKGLMDEARHARQNLERRFREKLLHEPLQKRKGLRGGFDKWQEHNKAH